MMEILMFIESLKDLESQDPSRAKELFEGYQAQRKFFFDRRMSELRKIYYLEANHEKVLWGYLLSAEQPKDEESPKEFHILATMTSLNTEQELCEKNPINKAYLGWLKIYWSKAWLEYVKEHRSFLAARFVIENLKNTGKDKISHYAGAENELINELNLCLPKADKFFLDIKDKNKIKEVNNKEVLVFDIKALDYFKSYNIGSFSKKAVKYFEDAIKSDDYSIEQRIRFWDDPLFLPKRIAAARWQDLVKKVVISNAANPPAFSLTMANTLVQLTTGGNRIEASTKKIVNEKNIVIADFEASACIPLVTAKDIVSKDIDALNSILAKRIIRFYGLKANQQHVLNVKTPNVIALEEGFYSLGELIGAGTQSKAIEKMKKIITIYSRCGYQVELDNKIVTGNILMYEFTESKRGKSQHLLVTLARAFCPGFVAGASKEDSRYNTNKLLVPILHKEPPFIGKNNTFCSQMNFLDWILIEMRLRAVELYERGGVLLNNENLLEIAKKARMSTNLIKPVLDCWLSENYLEQVDSSLYALGDNYKNEKNMLIEAGEKTLKGSLAGKKVKKNQRNFYMKENGSPL